MPKHSDNGRTPRHANGDSLDPARGCLAAILFMICVFALGYLAYIAFGK